MPLTAVTSPKRLTSASMRKGREASIAVPTEVDSYSLLRHASTILAPHVGIGDENSRSSPDHAMCVWCTTFRRLFFRASVGGRFRGTPEDVDATGRANSVLSCPPVSLTPFGVVAMTFALHNAGRNIRKKFTVLDFMAARNYPCDCPGLCVCLYYVDSLRGRISRNSLGTVCQHESRS